MTTHKTAAARAGHRCGGLELPDNWLTWKPFGYARKVSFAITLSGERAPYVDGSIDLASRRLVHIDYACMLPTTNCRLGRFFCDFSKSVSTA